MVSEPLADLQKVSVRLGKVPLPSQIALGTLQGVFRHFHVSLLSLTLAGPRNYCCPLRPLALYTSTQHSLSLESKVAYWGQGSLTPDRRGKIRMLLPPSPLLLACQVSAKRTLWLKTPVKLLIGCVSARLTCESALFGSVSGAFSKAGWLAPTGSGSPSDTMTASRPRTVSTSKNFCQTPKVCRFAGPEDVLRGCTDLFGAKSKTRSGMLSSNCGAEARQFCGLQISPKNCSSRRGQAAGWKDHSRTGKTWTLLPVLQQQ